MENNSNLIKCTDLNNNDDSKINLTKISNKKMNSTSENKKDNQNQIKIDPNLQSKINNYNKIKEFLSKNANDKSYSKIIKENPDSLFEKMNEQRIIIWESMLYNNSSPLRKNSDSEILYSPLDRPDQKVIKNDCRRTRVREGFLIPGYSKILEAILTYYCNTKKICYKQGLNEIFGSLILLKYKFKNMKLSKLFDIGEVFIDQYLPNYFYEKEIFSLQSSLSLFVILLKYHEPSVYNRLDSMEIIPEMYATNWVMTYAIGKLKLDIIYKLWDYIIEINDPLFLHFYFVSMIINQRELLINCEKTLLPTLMASLTIISVDELITVVEKAKELRKLTPYSFRILANKLGFLIKKNKNVQKNFEKYKPLSIPAMPIFPLEVFHITNHSEVECPDEDCENTKKILKNNKFCFEVLEKNNINKEYKCEKCTLNIEKKMKFFLLDLRILEYGINNEENESDKTGYLPLMINVDQNELKSEEIDDIISKRYINERGLFHFIFLTTSTDAFLNFEEKFYKSNISAEDEKKIMFGLMEKKTEKELNFDSGQISKKQIFKLKEYDNLRKILKSLKKQNYPYIGFVYGGFDLLHKKSLVYNIELLFHNEKTCVLCNQKKQKEIKEKKNIKEEKEKNELYNSLWEHKKKIKYQNLNEAFKDPKSTMIYFGSLINYKNKKIKEVIHLYIICGNLEIFKFLLKIVRVELF